MAFRVAAWGAKWLRAMAALLLAVTAGPAVAAGAAPSDPSDVGLGGTTRISGAFEGKVYAIPEDSGRLPAFGQLEPLGTIYSPTLDVAPRQFDQGFPGVTDRFEWFAIRYRGRLSLPAAGLYRFRTVSDDGVKVYVDDTLVIDHDSIHGPAAMEGQAELAAGSHCVTVDYFQGPRFQIALQLFMAPPGGEYAILDLREYASGGFSRLMHDGCGSAPFPWLELLLALLLGLLGLSWWRRKRREPEEERQQPQLKLSFPDIENDRPEQLLYAHELAADADGGDPQPGDPHPNDRRPRTRVRIECVPGGPDAAPFDKEFRLRVRCADPRAGEDGQPAPKAALYLRGKPVGDRVFMLGHDRVNVELRCEARAEGWQVVKTPDGSRFEEVRPASFIVELETVDRRIKVESPEVTIVHGAPAAIELANGPESVGLELKDLMGIARKPPKDLAGMEPTRPDPSDPTGVRKLQLDLNDYSGTDKKPLVLDEPVGEVTGQSFRWPSEKERALKSIPLRLGADRLLPSGFVEETDKGNKPVPMGSAVLILFTVRDRAGNPIRLLENDGRGFYQPSFRVRDAAYKGLRPFFVSPTGEIADTPGTRWVARPSPRTVLPLGVLGTLFVPASADFTSSTTTYFYIDVARVLDGHEHFLLEREFKAIVQVTPFAGKWARWLFEGEVEDAGTFLAELFISVIPLVGDGRDVIIHSWKEYRGVEKIGLMDELVFSLALAGLWLDVVNILVVGSATPIDTVVAVLKATAKLLRRLAKPDVMRELWARLSKKLGEQSAATFAALAAKVGDDAATAVARLADELAKRLETFLRNMEDFAQRGLIFDKAAMRKLANQSFSEFYAFGDKVKPYLSDIDKMQQLLSLMGMALAVVQLKDILALFAKHSVDEVIDLLSGLIMMDELYAQPDTAEAGDG